MPRVTDEHRASRADQVLDAAMRVFARGGFHATGMAEVIRESGLSAGSVYRYYPGKDALIAAVIGRLVAGLHAQLARTTAGARTPGEAVAGAVQGASSAFAQEGGVVPRLLPQVWTEALRDPAVARVVQERYSVVIGHFGALAEEFQARGTLPPGVDAGGAAHLMLAAVQGYMLQRVLLSGELDTDAYLGAARALLDAGLEGNHE